MKKFYVVFALLISVIALCSFACEAGNKTDIELARKQEQLMDEANRQTGMPAIINFQERKLMKMIYEKRDQANLVCWAYIQNMATGKFVFIGRCLGFGLPYSTQFTNPMKVIKFGNENSYAGQDPQTIPQADPNGLFMPASAEGTWLMLLDKNGNPNVVYIESRVTVSTFELFEGVQK